MTEPSDGSGPSILICGHFEEPHRVIETLEGDRPAVLGTRTVSRHRVLYCARHEKLTGGSMTANTGGEVDRCSGRDRSS